MGIAGFMAMVTIIFITLMIACACAVLAAAVAMPCGGNRLFLQPYYDINTQIQYNIANDANDTVISFSPVNLHKLFDNNSLLYIIRGGGGGGTMVIKVF
jgi:hypothetical protein